MEKYELLIDKIIEIRELFSDEEVDYYGLNHSPEFVLDAVIDKLKKVNKKEVY